MSTTTYHITEEIENICSELEAMVKASGCHYHRDDLEKLALLWKNIVSSEELKDIDEKEIKNLEARFRWLYSSAEEKLKEHELHKRLMDKAVEICERIEYLDKNFTEASKEEVDKLAKEFRSITGVPVQYWEILEKRFDKAITNFYTDLQQKEEARKEFVKKEPDLLKCCEGLEKVLAFTKLSDVKKIEIEIDKIKNKWHKLTQNLELPADISEKFVNILHRAELHLNFIRKQIEETCGNSKNLLEKSIQEVSDYLSSGEIRKNVSRVKEINREILKISECQIEDKEISRLKKQWKKVTAAFFKKWKEICEEYEWARWENYTRKLDICNFLEQLINREISREVIEKFKVLRNEWRNIGTVPKEKKEELYSHFYSLCDNLNAKIKDYFEILEQKKRENLPKKLALCEEVEKLKDSGEWLETAERIKKIQKEWKELGPLPDEYDEEIHTRFKNACNCFFERKKQHFKELKRIQAQNKRLKAALCEEAEKLLDIPVKEAFRKLAYLKNEWQRIGNAGKKNEQKLWNRYNRALDKFFEFLDSKKPENLEKKRGLLEKMSEIISEIEKGVTFEEMENLNVKFQKLSLEWNDIGQVPQENEEEIRSVYSDLTNKFSTYYKEHKKKLIQETEENIKQRRVLVERMEHLAKTTDDWSVLEPELKQIEEEWNKIPVLDKAKEEGVNRKFNSLLKGIREGDKYIFMSIGQEQKENLKKKIELCVRLEQMAGIGTPEEVLSTSNALSLAEELKLAMQQDFGNREKSSKSIDKELSEIKKQWDRIGPVPPEEEKKISSRFNNALEKLQNKSGRLK